MGQEHLEKHYIESESGRRLQAIEAERFATWDDPGIHGIKTRLSALTFVKEIEDCCSGHPQPEDFNSKAKGKFLSTAGYLPVMFDGKNSLSSSFHNSLCKVTCEVPQACRISFGGLGPDRESYSPLKSYTELAPPHYLLHSQGDVVINYQIAIERLGANLTPQVLAEALAKFWQEVSDFLNRYEQNPIPEKLESWYFGYRSKFGDMEVTHPDFEKFASQVKERGGKLK